MADTFDGGWLEEITQANQQVARTGLAQLTWGNVSGVDRDRGVFAIKPSGIVYDELRPDLLVVVALEDGAIVSGSLKPSIDVDTHRLLYRAFPSIGGITHTHSTYATAFAQARRPIPVLGTTHADTFNGPVPCTRDLSPRDCERDYEWNTGRAIVDIFNGDDDFAQAVPGALVANHGPFIWGRSSSDSVNNAIACEAIAEMALNTLTLSPDAAAPSHLVARHFRRKHGPDAYYGNPGFVPPA